MVLVEEGPWDEADHEAHLRRVQDRLYECVDAAVDGRLAEKFPESAGQRVLIRLDGYNLPGAVVREFFDRFASTVLQLPDYAAALAKSEAVASIGFELQLSEL